MQDPVVARSRGVDLPQPRQSEFAANPVGSETNEQRRRREVTQAVVEYRGHPDWAEDMMRRSDLVSYFDPSLYASWLEKEKGGSPKAGFAARRALGALETDAIRESWVRERPERDGLIGEARHDVCGRVVGAMREPETGAICPHCANVEKSKLTEGCLNYVEVDLTEALQPFHSDRIRTAEVRDPDLASLMRDVNDVFVLHSDPTERYLQLQRRQVSQRFATLRQRKGSTERGYSFDDASATWGVLNAQLGEKVGGLASDGGAVGAGLREEVVRIVANFRNVEAVTRAIQELNLPADTERAALVEARARINLVELVAYDDLLVGQGPKQGWKTLIANLGAVPRLKEETAGWLTSQGDLTRKTELAIGVLIGLRKGQLDPRLPKELLVAFGSMLDSGNYLNLRSGERRNIELALERMLGSDAVGLARQILTAFKIDAEYDSGHYLGRAASNTLNGGLGNLMTHFGAHGAAAEGGFLLASWGRVKGRFVPDLEMWTSVTLASGIVENMGVLRNDIPSRQKDSAAAAEALTRLRGAHDGYNSLEKMGIGGGWEARSEQIVREAIGALVPEQVLTSQKLTPADVLPPSVFEAFLIQLEAANDLIINIADNQELKYYLRMMHSRLITAYRRANPSGQDRYNTDIYGSPVIKNPLAQLGNKLEARAASRRERGLQKQAEIQERLLQPGLSWGERARLQLDLIKAKSNTPAA